MTLILNAFQPGYVIQTSDRLVSVVEKGNRLRPADPMANKSVIYFARDALVTIGYAGAAFIGNCPTDEWIARALVNDQMPDRFAFRLMGGDVAKWTYDLGQAVAHLQSRLNASFGAIPKSRRQHLELIIAGWLQNKRYIRQVGIRIHNPSKILREFEVENLLPRVRGPWESRCLLTPASMVKKIERDGLARDIEESKFSPEETMRKMVSLTRITARDRPVGPHCMAILMPSPGKGPVRTRFLAQAGSPRSSSTVGSPVPAACTPWVVGPTAIARPSVIVGGWTVDAHPNIQVIFDAPVASESGLRAGFFPQARPAPRDLVLKR